MVERKGIEPSTFALRMGFAPFLTPLAPSGTYLKTSLKYL